MSLWVHPEVIEARTYRLATNVRLFLGFGVLFFVFVVGGILTELARDGASPMDVPIFVAWLAFALTFFGYEAFTGVIAITLENHTVAFRTLLRSYRLPISALLSIETSWWDVNRFAPLIRHRGGTARLLGPFDEFYELVTRLRELNPQIEVKRL
jgi:hypothetical protein